MHLVQLITKPQQEKMDPRDFQRNLDRARRHLSFMCELYRMQLAAGRYFLHEHPAHATSWQDQEMKALLVEAGVVTAVCDQCMYGRESYDGSPVKKPTQFMTNAPELAKRFTVRCTGRGGKCSRRAGGVHLQCRDKVARKAAVYDFKLSSHSCWMLGSTSS